MPQHNSGQIWQTHREKSKEFPSVSLGKVKLLGHRKTSTTETHLYMESKQIKSEM
jgi:hypothetical protein